ncbi:MAG: hypothetical protein JW969_04455 [Spirochaetales bacterium]|nr:hypothetical protein [Spirochaetales bacterium]
MDKDDERVSGGEVINIEGKTVFRVKVIFSNATEFCIPEDGMEVKPGDDVIVASRYGRDLGVIQGIITQTSEINPAKIIKISRLATEHDLKIYEENKSKDKKAFDICRQKIDDHKLEMKLVSAHYLLDEPKVIFFFTAESRVDFRELVKDLVSVFKTRIELRQIGVRDETRVQGGLGICGRGFCCNTITDNLSPVSIKMAKEQNLSLNSLKISGACGRLLCCLAYEYTCYQHLKKEAPSLGIKFNIEKMDYTVTNVNIFTKKITLSNKSGKSLEYAINQFEFDNDKRKWSIRPELEP